MSLRTISKLKVENLVYIIDENNEVYIFRRNQIHRFTLSVCCRIKPADGFALRRFRLHPINNLIHYECIVLLSVYSMTTRKVQCKIPISIFSKFWSISVSIDIQICNSWLSHCRVTKWLSCESFQPDCITTFTIILATLMKQIKV